MAAIDRALSIEDLRRLAKNRLPASIFGYVDGASEDRVSLKENRSAFSRWGFLTHPLVNVSKRDITIEIFGEQYQSPVGISPMGVSALCGYEGDLSLAKAAKQVSAPFILSAASTVPVERVLKENPLTWYQAYIPADFSVIDPLLNRLKNANVKVLVITVDVQVASVRENELRNGFTIPLRPSFQLILGGLLRPYWLINTLFKTLLFKGVPRFENYTAERGGPIIKVAKGNHRAGRDAMTWADIARIRNAWAGTLIIKGILRPEDALKAEEVGADGIIVSNHGGRQLDGAIAPLDALLEIVKAVPKMTVMMDGGIRRGTDILKAYALGAKCVFVGRPVMYGLSAGGEAGVLKALSLLKSEVDVDLALLGSPSIKTIDYSYIKRID